ncbi:MAG TPA: head-tail adaptor protein, partial [Urbifossiella sp.]|nr:head-tail adaptor protein [Urbifossiella sp.]
MTAGEYPWRFEWLKKSAGTPDGFGQPSDSFPSQGTLWGALEGLSGSRTGSKESERQDVSATIRLRNYPAIAAGDRLR